MHVNIDPRRSLYPRCFTGDIVQGCILYMCVYMCVYACVYVCVCVCVCSEHVVIPSDLRVSDIWCAPRQKVSAEFREHDTVGEHLEGRRVEV